MLKTLLSGAAALFLATSAHGATIIDFENVPTGQVANGFSVGGISFFDTQRNDLYISPSFPNFNNRALSIGNDDASALLMTFAQISTNLSLAFGNDDNDECCSAPGDLALLRLFLNGSQVGQTTVALNLNEEIDQTIFINGIAFDSAIFGYVRPDLTPNTNMEAVDNISYSVAAVPEPSVWALMIAGFAFIGGALRRRRALELRLA